MQISEIIAFNTTIEFMKREKNKTFRYGHEY